MRGFFYKLFLGKPEYNKPIRQSIYLTHYAHLRRIWNNENHHDVGLEKVVRLLLVSVQFIFPGIHIRNYFGRMGVISRNVAIEIYVLSKTVLPLVFLFTGLYKYKAIILVSTYLMAESMCYVASLIFVSDMFVRPRSYRRNILMLFFNYLEISLCYAVVYAGLHLLGDTPKCIIDYIYFSIITSTTIGYGDIHPVANLGKVIACIQSVMVVAFVVLFLNFFGSRVEVHHKEEE